MSSGTHTNAEAPEPMKVPGLLQLPGTDASRFTEPEH